MKLEAAGYQGRRTANQGTWFTTPSRISAAEEGNYSTTLENCAGHPPAWCGHHPTPPA